MTSSPVEAGLAEAARIATSDHLQARLLLASVVTTAAAEVDQDIVVVGGTAVDTYVSGALGVSEGLPAGWAPSLDVDTLVVSTGGGNLEATRGALEDHGFIPSATGGAMHHPEVEAIVIDFVGRFLEPDLSEEHLVSVETERSKGLGLPEVTLVGPEDLLFDYLESAVITRHQRDWARAMAIAQAMEGRLDLGYLVGKAHWRQAGQFVEPLERVLAGEPLAGD